MASRTGTSKGVVIVRADDATVGGETAATRAMTATVMVINDTASTVIGGTDTLDLNVATEIQNSRRNGKTVTLRGAVVAIPAVVGNTVYTGSVALSGSTTIQITPKDTSWGGTPTLPANTSTTQRPYGITVVFTEA